MPVTPRGAVGDSTATSDATMMAWFGLAFAAAFLLMLCALPIDMANGPLETLAIFGP